MLQSGTGDIVKLIPYYNFADYYTSKRIQSFLEKAARGGNRVLRPKRDWFMWQYCLHIMKNDPDKMNANALNFVLGFLQRPFDINDDYFIYLLEKLDKEIKKKKD